MSNYNRGGGSRGGNRRNGPATLPDEPPFTAFIGHLPQGIIQSDIEHIFEECGISQVRMVYDKIDNKFKGYCYVEFSERSGLEKALEYNGAQIEGKSMKVDIAEQKRDNRRDGGNSRGRGGGDRNRQNSNRGRSGDDYGRQNSYGDRGYGRQNSQSGGGRMNSSSSNQDYQNFQSRERGGNFSRQTSNQNYQAGGARNRQGSHSSQGSHNQHYGNNDSAFNDPPAEEPRRRRLNLKPRTKPVDQEATLVRNEAIFGKGHARDELKQQKDAEEIKSGVEKLSTN